MTMRIKQRKTETWNERALIKDKASGPWRRQDRHKTRAINTVEREGRKKREHE